MRVAPLSRAVQGPTAFDTIVMSRSTIVEHRRLQRRSDARGAERSVSCTSPLVRRAVEDHSELLVPSVRPRHLDPDIHEKAVKRKVDPDEKSFPTRSRPSSDGTASVPVAVRRAASGVWIRECGARLRPPSRRSKRGQSPLFPFLGLRVTVPVPVATTRREGPRSDPSARRAVRVRTSQETRR